ncbi:hypothetical protein E4P29_10505 [Rhodococcus sp. 1R11]|nr:hypothetical protein E4P29_10505 [Rhodococcus sp. 1R11]
MAFHIGGSLTHGHSVGSTPVPLGHSAGSTPVPRGHSAGSTPGTAGSTPALTPVLSRELGQASWPPSHPGSHR